MTLLWRICFSAGIAFPLLAATVNGTVQLNRAKGAKSHQRGGDKDVVVWLDPAGGRPPPVKPGLARMLQTHKQFQPHVLAITVGTTVEFPNLDPIFHNAFSNIDGQPFDIGLYPPGTSRKVKFERAGIVRVFCNIHQSMSAVIVVADSPWIAVSNASGAFSIADVPPGRYVLHVFYERATKKALDGLTRAIEVGAGGLVLPPIEVSETGYIEVPHKNKFGRDYPPDSGDAPYGGGR